MVRRLCRSSRGRDLVEIINVSLQETGLIFSLVRRMFDKVPRMSPGILQQFEAHSYQSLPSEYIYHGMRDVSEGQNPGQDQTDTLKIISNTIIAF